MKAKPIATLLLSLILGILPACSVFQTGAPAAALVVNATSEEIVRAAVMDVFTRAGYRADAVLSQEITFIRAASKADEVFYGNWGDSKANEKVVVRITEKGAERYQLACLPSFIRSPNSGGMEDEQRRITVYSPHLKGLLNQVAKELRR